MAENDSGSVQPDGGAANGGDGGPKTRGVWETTRWLLLRGLALGGTFLLMLALMTGFAGWYTSRPEFCRSCHIMEPYYVSWQESSHRDVSCVKCHFPPGAGEKIRGKMLGLVQLAKYVTSTEGPRPAAEVPDASCLRSGCHETRLLAGRVEFHGVPFDHGPHLEELRRGMNLRCTSCHSQIVQGTHMTVTPSTCFLCHFKSEPFNEGLGACTRCHQIPEAEYDLGGGVKFTHELAYERGVDCANCHGDLIRGQGDVPLERCTVCHNREDDLSRINDHEFMHRTHVSDHKVDCIECHLQIKHSLDPNRIQNAAADCKSCHPDHHQEQVNMLLGIGAKSVPSQPSGMTEVRIACATCHREKDVSPTGTVLWKASMGVCADCHKASDSQQLFAYHEALRAALPQIDAAIVKIQEGLPAAKLGAQESVDATKELEKIKSDWHFLRVGNDIHNIHYAASLTDALVKQLQALADKVKIEMPKVALPDPGTIPSKSSPDLEAP